MFVLCYTNIQGINACAAHVSSIVLSKLLALQGIPDEYDEADINRLFSGKVFYIPSD